MVQQTICHMMFWKVLPQNALLTPLLICLSSYPMEWILGYFMTSSLLTAMCLKYLVRKEWIEWKKYIPCCLYVFVQYRHPSLSSFDLLGPNYTAGFSCVTRRHIGWKIPFPFPVLTTIWNVDELATAVWLASDNKTFHTSLASSFLYDPGIHWMNALCPWMRQPAIIDLWWQSGGQWGQLDVGVFQGKGQQSLFICSKNRKV